MNIKQLKIIAFFFFVGYLTFFGIAVWVYKYKDKFLGLNLFFDLLLILLTYGFIMYVLEYNTRSRSEKIKNIAKKILDRDFFDIDNYLGAGFIGKFDKSGYHLNKEKFLESNADNVFQRIIEKLESFRIFLEYFDPEVINKFIDIQKNFDTLLRHSIHLIKGPTIAFLSNEQSMKITELRISKVKTAMDFIKKRESLKYSSSTDEW